MLILRAHKITWPSGGTESATHFMLLSAVCSAFLCMHPKHILISFSNLLGKVGASLGESGKIGANKQKQRWKLQKAVQNQAKTTQDSPRSSERGPRRPQESPEPQKSSPMRSQTFPKGAPNRDQNRQKSILEPPKAPKSSQSRSNSNFLPIFNNFWDDLGTNFES